LTPAADLQGHCRRAIVEKPPVLVLPKGVRAQLQFQEALKGAAESFGHRHNGRWSGEQHRRIPGVRRAKGWKIQTAKDFGLKIERDCYRAGIG
jgi:hypothetical protein